MFLVIILCNLFQIYISGVYNSKNYIDEGDVDVDQSDWDIIELESERKKLMKHTSTLVSKAQQLSKENQNVREALDNLKAVLSQYDLDLENDSTEDEGTIGPGNKSLRRSLSRRMPRSIPGR